MYDLREWSIVTGGDGYTAPEVAGIRLSGLVFGHPRFWTGEPITTSHVVAAEGRLITTASGSVYRLGEPSAKYRAFCVEIGKPIDDAQPIKVIK